jgi:hypothetical protein
MRPSPQAKKGKPRVARGPAGFFRMTKHESLSGVVVELAGISTILLQVVVFKHIFLAWLPKKSRI